MQYGMTDIMAVDHKKRAATFTAKRSGQSCCRDDLVRAGAAPAVFASFGYGKTLCLACGLNLIGNNRRRFAGETVDGVGARR